MSGGTWRVEVRVPIAAAEPFEHALERFCPAVSLIPEESAGTCRLAGDAPNLPEPRALAAALAVAALAAGIDEPDVRVTEVGARDWLRDSLLAFPPIRAGRFFLYGSHYHGPFPAAAKALEIDAATAFGSGEHPTTRGCLLALDDLARKERPARVLDVGCGSGVLAMAAARAWPTADVIAADIDPEAVRVARDNIRRNRLARRVRAVCAPGYAHAAVRRAAPFDLIVANILARPLCRLARDLGRHLAPGGVAVLSGFLDPDSPRLEAAHRHARLRVSRRIALDGWTTLILRA